MYSTAVRLSVSTKVGVAIACIGCHPGVTNHHMHKGPLLFAFSQDETCVQICMHSLAIGTGLNMLQVHTLCGT